MKSRTHVFMANLLIEDLKKRTITLPGIGDFTPPAEVKNAILKYPSAFRAGAVGPDFYPDVFCGQAVIHPEHSGKWLDLMFKRLTFSTPEDFEKNFAFALGFMFHYAGDMFGHEYVNSYAGGWFPAYEEVITNPEKAKIIARHLLVESYMDSKVPSSAEMRLDAPMEFIRDTFYCKEATDLAPDSKVNLPRKFAQLRNEVHNILGKTMIGLTPILTNEIQAWEKKIDEVIGDWLIVWADAAILFNQNRPNKIKPVATLTEDWMKYKLPLMLACPKRLIDIIVLLDKIKVLEPLKDYIKNKFKDYLIVIVKAITGEIYQSFEEAVEAIKDIFKDPKKYLDSGLLFSEKNISAKLDKDFGNYGLEYDTTEQSFHAVYQCINMGKLLLLSVDDLNKLVSNYCSSGSPLKYVGAMTCPAAKIRTLTVKTSHSYWAGTNSNVYIGIRHKGKIYEVLCDKAFYDDFERTSIDTYDFYVPENVDLSAIDGITARMSGSTLASEWKCDWIKINDNKGNTLLEVKKEFKLDSGETKVCEITRNYKIEQKNIPVDPRIMSFLHSLDGKGLDNSNPAKEKQWEIGFQFYSDQGLRDKVFEPLFNKPAQITPKIKGIVFHIGNVINCVTFEYNDGHIDIIGEKYGDRCERCDIAPTDKIIGYSVTKCLVDGYDAISRFAITFSDGREKSFAGLKFYTDPDKRTAKISASADEYIISFGADVSPNNRFVENIYMRETKPL